MGIRCGLPRVALLPLVSTMEFRSSFSRREGNQKTRRKNPEAKKRTNKQLYSHMRGEECSHRYDARTSLKECARAFFIHAKIFLEFGTDVHFEF